MSIASTCHLFYERHNLGWPDANMHAYLAFKRRETNHLEILWWRTVYHLSEPLTYVSIRLPQPLFVFGSNCKRWGGGGSYTNAVALGCTCPFDAKEGVGRNAEKTENVDVVGRRRTWDHSQGSFPNNPTGDKIGTDMTVMGDNLSTAKQSKLLL